MDKDMSPRMLFEGNMEQFCNHYCKNTAKKGNFYSWYTFLDNKYIKTMCEKCAKRETWGSYFNSNKNYKKWECSG